MRRVRFTFNFYTRNEKAMDRIELHLSEIPSKKSKRMPKRYCSYLGHYCVFQGYQHCAISSAVSSVSSWRKFLATEGRSSFKRQNRQRFVEAFSKIATLVTSFKRMKRLRDQAFCLLFSSSSTAQRSSRAPISSPPPAPPSFPPCPPFPTPRSASR